MENRRKFLGKLKIQLNIRKPRDWGKITIQEFEKSGGSSLLNGYYKHSLFACLESVYRGLNCIFIYFLTCRD